MAILGDVFEVIEMINDDVLWAMHAEERAPLMRSVSSAAGVVFKALPKEVGADIDCRIVPVFRKWPKYLDVSVSRRVNFAAYAWALQIMPPRPLKGKAHYCNLQGMISLLTYSIEAHLDAQKVNEVLGRQRKASEQS